MGNNLDTLISGSVGRGGANQKDDVLIVQFLFNLISSNSYLRRAHAMMNLSTELASFS